MRKQFLILGSLWLCGWAPAAVGQTVDGHSAHRQTANVQKRAPKTPQAQNAEFRILRITRVPENFMGGVAYDQESRRLWLLSFGPPANTKTASILYELDINTGSVLRHAKMPFLGEFGAPVFLDGHLYVGIAHVSRLHKISVDAGNFGAVVSTWPLPTLNDIQEPITEPFRFPFINFPGLAVSPDKNLVLHAEDLGLFLTIDKNTGAILKTVRTIKGLSAAVDVPGPDGRMLLLGNADPETARLKRDLRVFMFRSTHGFTPPYAVTAQSMCGQAGSRDLTWTLLDPDSGEVVASTLDRCSRARAGSVALLKHEAVPGFPFGRYTFVSLGEEGLLTAQWNPK